MLDERAALAGLGGVVLAAIFFVLWLVQRRTKDASLVDVAWAAALGMLAIGYAVFASGLLARRIALAIVVGVWSLRLVVKVTGIPPTEERSLATRGDDYRVYQSSTSAFAPWFPKKAQKESVA